MHAAQSTAIYLILTMGAAVSATQGQTAAMANLPDAPKAHVMLAGAIETPHTEGAQAHMEQKMGEGNAFAVTSRPEPKSLRVVDGKFIFINGLHLGLALADTEMTQACIAERRCREGNPLMPSSHAGQLAVDFGFFAYATGTSYWFKKHHSGLWWLPALGGSLAHTAGLVTGLLHQ
ncbi:MAG TPA: hypothetical protein VG844_18965 [Terracidiphilus sp.]|nr:hypothetical protein [Terracidiphilus sp.]